MATLAQGEQMCSVNYVLNNQLISGTSSG
jgi:WD40 repeat protein